MALNQKPPKSSSPTGQTIPTLARAKSIESRVPAMPWTDLDVPTRHGRVAVRLGHGQGVPLLFLHGNSSSKEVFVGQMSGRLREACRMIALDLPGHGASQDALVPERSYSVRGYADAVVEVLDALDLPQVALVGWSLGGHVAIEVAARYPDVLGLMLCGTPPVGLGADAIMAGFVPSPSLSLAGQAMLSRDDIDSFARLAYGGQAGPADLAAVARTDGRARAMMVADLFGGGASDQRAFVEAAPMPVAIVNGCDDPLVDAGYLKTLRSEALWYRRIHLIEGGGHAPFRTRPEAFDALLARFIRSMRRRQMLTVRAPSLCFSG